MKSTEMNASSMELEQRRQPVQERSRERVERILTVAARLISEKGVDALKTSEIAREAGISLASLYRYFPNKAAVIKALAEQHIRKLDAHLKAFAESLDLDNGFDQLIDTYARFYRSEPGYKEIWSGVEAMPELQALDLGELYDNARVVSEAAQARFPDVDPDRLWLICVMLPRACGAVLRLAMTMSEDQAAVMVDELKLMVKSYLRVRLAP
ncbi:TetR/AcrR family transcriptional regulator [Hahella sp. SMD15-11]|uniref:TetR/AcrR family transcriptional regulator n=1 Tax=Thermohahella caldifontis TaxID=3142973 RepID=A0AB39UWF2_9GAMM